MTSVTGKFSITGGRSWSDNLGVYDSVEAARLRKEVTDEVSSILN